jgi:hypothetical protein
MTNRARKRRAKYVPVETDAANPGRAETPPTRSLPGKKWRRHGKKRPSRHGENASDFIFPIVFNHHQTGPPLATAGPKNPGAAGAAQT